MPNKSSICSTKLSIKNYATPRKLSSWEVFKNENFFNIFINRNLHFYSVFSNLNNFYF